MNDLPRYALQVRCAHGWRTLVTFDTTDEALRWLMPGDRVIPAEPRPSRLPFLIGLLFAAVVGFSLGTVLMRHGPL